MQPPPKRLNRKEKEMLKDFLSHPQAPTPFKHKGMAELIDELPQLDPMSPESFARMPQTHYALSVPGDPVPKARPRFSRGKAYTPASTKTAENAIAWTFRGTYQGYWLDKRSEFGVRLLFVCRRRRGGQPDVDNLAKLVLDALTGILWADDRQITELLVKRKTIEEGAGCTVIYAYVIGDPSDL